MVKETGNVKNREEPSTILVIQKDSGRAAEPPPQFLVLSSGFLGSQAKGWALGGN
jgi:hypothetical protein